MAAPSRRGIWIGFAIFAAAAALRLALVETARFTGDESRDYAIAVEGARSLRFPMLGPLTTTGQARLPGPLFHWMGAIPHFFSRAPEASYVFFELLGAAGVWMFWRALRRPFGEAGAAFAAALMALSPWSALFGDRIWNPHAFLFVELLAFLAVMELRDRPQSAWAIVAVVAVLALPQLHLAAPVVWGALLPLARPWRWRRRYVGIGAALGLLLYVPFAVHEARTGFGNARLFVGGMLHPKAGGEATGGSAFLLGPLYTLRFLTLDVTYHELTGYWGGLDEAVAWHALWHGSPARPFHPLRLVALLASFVLAALALVAVLRNAWQRARTGGWRSAVGVLGQSALIVVVLDVALLRLASKQVFAHYVLPTLPFVFVVFAALGRGAFAGRWMGVAAGLLAAIVCLGGIEATLSISRRIDARNGLAVHRAVAGQFLADCAATGRSPATTPLQLSFGFTAVPNSYAVFLHTALDLPTPVQSPRLGPAYSLQKREDALLPRPFDLVSRIGPVALYRRR